MRRINHYRIHSRNTIIIDLVSKQRSGKELCLFVFLFFSVKLTIFGEFLQWKKKTKRHRLLSSWYLLDWHHLYSETADVFSSQPSLPSKPVQIGFIFSQRPQSLLSSLTAVASPFPTGLVVLVAPLLTDLTSFFSIHSRLSFPLLRSTSSSAQYRRRSLLHSLVLIGFILRFRLASFSSIQDRRFSLLRSALSQIRPSGLDPTVRLNLHTIRPSLHHRLKKKKAVRNCSVAYF